MAAVTLLSFSLFQPCNCVTGAEKEKKTKDEKGLEFESKSYFVNNAFILFNKATEIVSECFGTDPPMDVK
ncbi:hypothetical protein AMELA_G00152320, partial [Ameiurus melas]